MNRYYIIEHPTRGILKSELSDEGKASFSRVMNRNDEKAARYTTLRYALLEASSINGAYVVRTPERRGEQWKRHLNGDWIEV